MPDVYDPHKRSWIMSRIRSRNTGPEVLVRSLIHRMGYRFRLHHRKLPGHPDIVLARHRKVVFVNGCFWHGHENCRRSKLPSTNADFWSSKIARNKERDAEAMRMLSALGWRTLVIWQCETRDRQKLLETLTAFFEEQHQRS